MPDLWFFAGLAMGIAIAGFAAVGSYARGADSEGHLDRGVTVIRGRDRHLGK